MRLITLIACASTKAKEPRKAIELYQSDLFKKKVAYAYSIFTDEIYILSAKKGLVHQNEIIEPYDLTLNDMTTAECYIWALRVITQLELVEDVNNCKFVILAGNNYRQTLEINLPYCTVPMKGLGIGQQLQWLKQQCIPKNINSAGGL